MAGVRAERQGDRYHPAPAEPSGRLPGDAADLPWTDWHDWSLVCAALERATPKFTPGSTLSYHPINYGWVIAELVRRIDGPTFDRFIAEDLARPLQMEDTYVGLPAELEGRVSRIHLMEQEADANGYAVTFDRPEVHQVICPGANGIASATWPGSTRPWSARVRWTGPRCCGPRPSRGHHDAGRGHRPVAGAVRAARAGLRFERRADGQAHGRPDAHLRARRGGTSIGWADLDTGLAVGYITNGFRGADKNNARLAEVSQAVRDACA
ncbi:Beta-lactamase domain-containing protein 2 [Geodia barretti]|uniref:Beta-lactamase domain-containing protein 2 n=1 Tax=Geodia barretti TaxID=519541 RepID=A0AA35XBY6_GEOBA|nr:Beta-lactamase domain-containing protein 2 [Geodia barretti]